MREANGSTQRQGSEENIHLRKASYAGRHRNVPREVSTLLLAMEE